MEPLNIRKYEREKTRVKKIDGKWKRNIDFNIKI